MEEDDRSGQRNSRCGSERVHPGRCQACLSRGLSIRTARITSAVAAAELRSNGPSPPHQHPGESEDQGDEAAVS
jgi:hypothetical protein